MNENRKESFDLKKSSKSIPNCHRVVMDTKTTATEAPKTYKLINLYREFHEFSRKQIRECEKTFNSYDTTGDGLLQINELKYIMEKLGEPQTHLDLKKLIAEVDKDKNNKISFPQFLLIYRNVKACELVDNATELNQLVPLPPVIDVDVVGVKGAKYFFETKIKQLCKRQNLDDRSRFKDEEEPKHVSSSFDKNGRRTLDT